MRVPSVGSSGLRSPLALYILVFGVLQPSGDRPIGRSST